jgi:alpha-glucosidase
MMTRFAVLLPLLVSMPIAAQDHSLLSPDGRTEIRIHAADGLSYTVLRNDVVLLAPSALTLTLADAVVGAGPTRVTHARERSVRDAVRPVVRTKRSEIPEHFNELRLSLADGFAVAFRAYDNGIAYRWEIDGTGEITVLSEGVTFGFEPADTVFFPEEESFFSHNERRYIRYLVGDISGDQLASLPALVAKPSGVKVWISEANVRDYAGLWLRGTGGSALVGTHPGYPLEERLVRDRSMTVTRRADYVAVTRGPRTLPWRVLGIAERDVDLIDNQLVFLLADESEGDYSWVRPGKVPWDWWNAINLYGVDFQAGVNTASYMHFIDFAAEHGLEYLILDEGWSTPSDLFAINPAIDMPTLLEHARQNDVGVILWVLWNALDRQLDEALDLFQQWGIRGLKVDFMQRDDQKMVNYYERVAREAARRQMLVDFHGSHKPTGLERTHPNVMTSEGVMGLEHNKWSDNITPAHNLTLPFIRMVAGPMDYTPGAMRNAAQGTFAHIFTRPMSQGTRAHQLAMYVVYESPLQMLADVPSNYRREPEAMAFLGPVPAVWDETVVIDGRIGEYVLLARRAANGDWYVGAMTDWTSRELTLDLTFLGDGTHRMEVWQDGPNAARFGEDFIRFGRDVQRGDQVTVPMAPGGGWVARIRQGGRA